MEKKTLFFSLIGVLFVATIFFSGCLTPPSENTNETHMECNDDNQCVEVEGSGEDDCTENADCVEVQTHMECNADEQCVEVDGEGTDECTENADCVTEEETYFACVNESCIEVEGSEEDECTENADCVEVQTHLECVNESCVEVEGEGNDTCTENADCVVENVTHMICSEGACIEVDGEGTDSCINDSDCMEEVDIAALYVESSAGTGWTDCSVVNGGWSTIDEFCVCEGYYGALSSSGNPCLIGFESTTPTFEWNYSNCSFSMGEEHDPGTNAMKTVKCLISEE